MIVSGRGIEWGFSPLTHPDDFSNQDLRRGTREIASWVLEQLPAPGSPEAKALTDQLAKSGQWHYRRKQRLDPNQSEFQTLDNWLSFVRSDEGVRNAGGRAGGRGAAALRRLTGAAPAAAARRSGLA
jgi:hypothetical protein